MANVNTDEKLKLRNNLEAMALTELRKYANANFGITVTRDHTKEDLVNMVVDMATKGNYARAAEGELKPGWARIKLAATGDYRSAIPLPLNANGYVCQIPFGVEVDVPIRVLESLKNAIEFKVGINEFGERIHQFRDSYPFNIIGLVEGPDPRPGLEVAREARLRPRKKFVEQFGFYPTDKVFKEFVQSGMFKLDVNDYKVASA